MKSFGNIAKDGQVRAVASGALTDGGSVVINSNGTVSAPFTNNYVFNAGSTFTPSIATNGSGTFLLLYKDGGDSNKGKVIAGTISGSTVTFGTAVEVVAEMKSDEQSSTVVYDPDNSKFVIVYSDDGAGGYLTTRVVTVSGTTPSLGTAVVVDSKNVIASAAVYDTSADKIVIGWRGHTNDLVAGIVGTVSGTSISYGSATTVASKRPNSMSAVYDTNADKTVFFYRDDADTADGYYVVCTVSGTSISGGSTAAFNAADTNSISATYDSTAQKIVIAYQDVGNSNYGSAIVGTVSGTSMTFGSEINFSGTSYVGSVRAQYDSTNNKTFIFYDKADSAMTALIGTVSGTSISVGSENTISTGNASYTSSAFSTDSGKILLVYRDNANSNYGTLDVIDSSFSSGNLTSENFIGFSDGAFADGQSAVINTANTIDRNQTSLTAGQTYFVTSTGALSLTAGSPSVTAGTAISATEIIVKG